MRLILAAILVGIGAPVVAAPVLDTPLKDEWWQAGEAAIDSRIEAVNRPKRAKNVILMIGDGMGIATITAGRIYDAQYPTDGSPRRTGEENSLSFEKLPHVALVKTYNTNAQVADSAGTASAMNTGVKTRIGYINFGQNQTAADCATPDKLPRTIAEIAKRQGMAVGIVTTTRITHATPAAVYGHEPNRNWEGSDKAYSSEAHKDSCPDLASQLVDFKPGGGLDLALGGGAGRFLPISAGGLRDDGVNLVTKWQGRFTGGRYVSDAAGFRALKPGAPGPVLGLFAMDHLTFEADRDTAKEPSLTEMAQFAVAKMKASSPEGYYLMIEGGRIDHAHHASNPSRALSETQQFSRAVAAVLATVDLNETLVLVTADHSHTLTMAGYPERGNDILGYIKNAAAGESRGNVSPEGYALDDRGQPMTTLSYANGAFVTPGLSRRLAPNDKNYLSDKTYGTDGESHGGEDVALFADGPRSELVSGVIEQNVIFHIIAAALGWR
ncbi:alkaline phosphatase [Polymorphobacter glacialis]|uniref:Alkaline phosphatase n=1 Tax=Sandarakinorhabdus glacialis TaxID=1614636 RepID=A0A916ZNU9_9SPHN|nr:alkaline phosphatase [Polymorphobacter glacialis]GGE06973.1 alkaline phosphatase [Polymorphobacter glacialis]